VARPSTWRSISASAGCRCRWLLTATPTLPLALLVGGGIAYSLGAVVHARSRWRFHNALWHALVLVGAALHFVAIARLVGAA